MAVCEAVSSLQLIWIKVYYLETKCNEQETTVVAKLTKAELQCFCLYLYETPVEAGVCFAYWMLSSKVLNQLIWTIKFKGCVRYIFASLFCVSKREHWWNKENIF